MEQEGSTAPSRKPHDTTVASRLPGKGGYSHPPAVCRRYVGVGSKGYSSATMHEAPNGCDRPESISPGWPSIGYADQAHFATTHARTGRTAAYIAAAGG